MAKTEKKTPAVEKAVAAVKETVEETKKAAKAVKEAKAPKAPKAAKEPKAAKAPKAVKAKAPAVKVFLEYRGIQVSQEAILEAVKADWKGEAIKTLEVYVKPEDGAAYYVVNGDSTGKVGI